MDRMRAYARKLCAKVVQKYETKKKKLEKIYYIFNKRWRKVKKVSHIVKNVSLYSPYIEHYALELGREFG